MSGVRNLHRITGALTGMRREAASGPCNLHPSLPAVGYVESWDLHPKGACAACLDQGERLGYTIHRTPPAAANGEVTDG